MQYLEDVVLNIADKSFRYHGAMQDIFGFMVGYLKHLEYLIE